MSGTLMAVGVESTAVYGLFQMEANWDAGGPSFQVLIKTDVPDSYKDLVVEGGSFPLNSCMAF